jgi:uncharacterized protein DUF4376
MTNGTVDTGISSVMVSDHYWAIGGSTSDVYQSKTNTMVPVDNTDYTDWLNAVSSAPTPIASIAELATVLQTYGMQLPDWQWNAPSFIQPTSTTYDKPQLIAYTADARWRKQTGGINVTGVDYRTDRVSSNERNNAYNYSQANPGYVFDWKLPDGSFVTLDQAAMTKVTMAESTFIQNCFTKENATVTSINGGTITTLAEIDAAFAAVSNVFP